MKDEAVRKVQSATTFIKVDVADTTIHKEMGKVDIGLVADRALKDLFHTK